MQAVCYGMEKSLTGNLSAMCEKKVGFGIECFGLSAAVCGI